MKRLVFTLLIVGIIAVPAMSLPTVNVQGLPGYWMGSGGEFTLTLKPSADYSWVLNQYAPVAKNAGGTTGTFESFCLETREYIDLGGTYDVVFNDKAVWGGVGPVGDPISQGTVYLYHEFQNGTLDDYIYTQGPGRVASAAALQNTIWWLEGEANVEGETNIFGKAVIAKFGDAAGNDYVGCSPVAVMNLYAKDGRHQDMLICVPAPGAILLGSIGLGLVGWLRRRGSF